MSPQRVCVLLFCYFLDVETVDLFSQNLVQLNHKYSSVFFREKKFINGIFRMPKSPNCLQCHIKDEGKLQN